MSAAVVLPINEIFCSLQGEGYEAGRPCVFVRLAGCHLSCPWCDTPYTWKPGVFGPQERRPMHLEAVLTAVAAYRVPRVEVTGGEPLLHPDTPALLSALADAGYEVSLETSGTLSVAGLDPRVRLVMDLKPPSSGHAGANAIANLALLRPGIDELKIVIADRADYDWAATLLAAHAPCEGVRVVFSPVTPLDWAGDFATWTLPRELAGWMLADRSRAALQLQLHRLLWPEALRGIEEGHSP